MTAIKVGMRLRNGDRMLYKFSR